MMSPLDRAHDLDGAARVLHRWPPAHHARQIRAARHCHLAAHGKTPALFARRAPNRSVERRGSLVCAMESITPMMSAILRDLADVAHAGHSAPWRQHDAVLASPGSVGHGARWRSGPHALCGLPGCWPGLAASFGHHPPAVTGLAHQRPDFARAQFSNGPATSAPADRPPARACRALWGWYTNTAWSSDVPGLIT